MLGFTTLGLGLVGLVGLGWLVEVLGVEAEEEEELELELLLEFVVVDVFDGF